MKHSREMKIVLQALRDTLVGWPLPKTIKSRRTRYTCPPLLGDDEFCGVKLRNIMSPTCYIPVGTLNDRFGELVWWINEGRPQSHKDYLFSGMTSASKKFIGYSPERFLIWAGNHKDVTLEVGDNDYLMAACENTFGLAEGQAYSTELSVPFTSFDSTLRSQTRHETRECSFIALLHRAKELGRDDAVAALGALRAHRDTRLDRMAPWVLLQSDPIDYDLIGRVIAEANDPISEIYSLVVPARMTRDDFEKRLGALEARCLNPSQAQRRSLWAKLVRIGVI